MGYYSNNIIIEEQTAPELVVRVLPRADTVINPLYNYNTACPGSATTTLRTITGSGMFYHARFITHVNSNSHFIQPTIVIDTAQIWPPYTYFEYNAHSYDKTTDPFKLIEYGADATCCLFINIPDGLPYSSSLTFQAYNSSATAQTTTLSFFATGY